MFVKPDKKFLEQLGEDFPILRYLWAAGLAITTGSCVVLLGMIVIINLHELLHKLSPTTSGFVTLQYLNTHPEAVTSHIFAVLGFILGTILIGAFALLLCLLCALGVSLFVLLWKEDHQAPGTPESKEKPFDMAEHDAKIAQIDEEHKVRMAALVESFQPKSTLHAIGGCLSYGFFVLATPWITCQVFWPSTWMGYTYHDVYVTMNAYINFFVAPNTLLHGAVTFVLLYMYWRILLGFISEFSRNARYLLRKNPGNGSYAQNPINPKVT